MASDDKISFYQSKICRICLNSGEMVSLFKRNMQKVYEEVTSLTISNLDHMPKVICSHCFRRINDAYSLIMQARRSYGNFCESNEEHEEDTTITTTSKEEKNSSPKNDDQYESVKIQFVEDSNSVDSNKGDTDDDYEDDLDSRLQEIVGGDEDDEDNVDEDEDHKELVLEVVTNKEEGLSDTQFKHPISDQSCGDEDDDMDAVSFLIERQLGDEHFISKKTSSRKKSKSQDRKHECQVCHKKFLRKSNLVDHLRLHANVKLFKCEFCDKAFVQSGNYRSHIRIHTNERPYVCHICPKTYNQSGALKIHIRSHTNERNYKCDLCLKAFTNSSDLGKHKRVHDPAKKVKCQFCDKSFAQNANLKLHIRNNHRDKMVKAES